MQLVADVLHHGEEPFLAPLVTTVGLLSLPFEKFVAFGITPALELSVRHHSTPLVHLLYA